MLHKQVSKPRRERYHSRPCQLLKKWWSLGLGVHLEVDVESHAPGLDERHVFKSTIALYSFRPTQFASVKCCT